MDESVRRYYDANTRIFDRSEFSRRRRAAVHRPLDLPPGLVPGLSRNADGVDALLLDALTRGGVRPGRGCRLLDLGCGVGGTMEWITRTTGATVSGVTISPVQAQAARRRLGHRARVEIGSFTDPNALSAVCAGEPPDAAYMIESFVHGDDPVSLLQELSLRIRPGGLLVVIDDFPAIRSAERLRIAPEDRQARSLQKLVARFRAGWHINTYLTTVELSLLAGQAGWRLIEQIDLSPWVRTNRFRDYLARASSQLLGPLRPRGSYWENVAGGGALQRLTRMRANRYELLVFTRESSLPVE